MELRQEVLDKFIKKLAEILKVSPDTLSENTNVKKDITVKSMQLVALITYFEDEYDLAVDYMALLHTKTIGESVDYIVSLING